MSVADVGVADPIVRLTRTGAGLGMLEMCSRRHPGGHGSGTAGGIGGEFKLDCDGEGGGSGGG